MERGHPETSCMQEKVSVQDPVLLKRFLCYRSLFYFLTLMWLLRLFTTKSIRNRSLQEVCDAHRARRRLRSALHLSSFDLAGRALSCCAAYKTHTHTTATTTPQPSPLSLLLSHFSFIPKKTTDSCSTRNSLQISMMIC